jgi:hypothetical protein
MLPFPAALDPGGKHFFPELKLVVVYLDHAKSQP